MVALKFYASSRIDNNLFIERMLFNRHETWVDYLKSFPHVIDAEFFTGTEGGFVNRLDVEPYTIITFDSEEHKNWFVLRWS